MFSNPFYLTSLEYWNTSTLNYTIYWILAVFFGWAGLDLLYLRSPWMAITKIILNLVTFGYLWLYDAIEATFNKKQVELVGPSMPFYGPLGIGGGQFMGKPGTPEQMGKHWTFTVYTLVLTFMGIFGTDSFLVGDLMSGWIRLLSLISVIFAPVAIIWWVYKMFMFWFKTGDVLNQEYEFFGAPKPPDANVPCPNAMELFTVWLVNTTGVILNYIPIVNTFVPILRTLEEQLRTAYGMAKVAVTIATTAVPAIASAATSALKEGVAAKVQLPQLPQLQSQTLQVGGSDMITSAKSVLLLIALGAIIVSSLSITLWRSWKNGTAVSKTEDDKRGSERNDDPPRPADDGETHTVYST